MDCNKEEAFRAKQLAEMRMQKNDFGGALRIAQKAQRLFPELENISQLLAVCEVHCSAERKLGSEPDLYAILQIERSADEIIIKKQYRKLALLLHPDKNKFAGSEAAFKLISEANSILSDHAKRSLYDIKLRNIVNAAKQMPPTHQSSQNTRKHDWTSNNFGNASNSQVPNSSHPQVEDQVFWTMCPLCNVKYQYYKRLLHKALLCQNCMKPFIAYNLGTQGVYQKDVSNSGSSRRASQASGEDNLSKSKGNTDGDGRSKTQGDANGHMHVRTERTRQGMPKPDTVKGKPQNKGDLTSGSKKRMRDPAMGSNGTSSEMDGKSSGDNVATNRGSPVQPKSEFDGSCTTRRSSRQKQSVSYEENLDDDGDFATKKSKTDKASHVSEDDNKHEAMSAKNGINSKLDDDSTSDGCVSEPEILLCPDPEFNDFEKDKAENCFCVNQVWAIYDTTDGMPRFYARVRKVLSPGSKVKIKWFEANPDDEDEIRWCDEDLPVACGRYKCEETEEILDIPMFSHQVRLTNGSNKISYLVYPRKGETWALFKNWDIKWNSEPEKHTSFEFEFVEILSNFDKEIGITVGSLVKVKGFVSLFQRLDPNTSFQISKRELYRFSHQVPSFRMTGNEGKGVPAGCFELDPAALPADVTVRGDAADNVANPTSSERIQSPKNLRRESKLGTESSVRRSPRGLGKMHNGDVPGNEVKSDKREVETVTKEAEKHGDCGACKGNDFPSQSKVSSASLQPNRKVSTPAKLERKNLKQDTSHLRRSPRDLHRCK